MWSYNYSTELCHHGIKGQRWGVRRDKHQLTLQRAGEIEKTNAINSGEISTKVNNHQNKHLRNARGNGSKLFVNTIKEAQVLINQLVGTGSAVTDKNGNWMRKERVKSNRLLDFHVDAKGNIVKTKNAMIVYAKDGAHIYPRR